MPLAPPDPEQISMGAKVATFLASVGGTAFGVFKMLNGRIVAVDKKVDLKASIEELNRQRNSIGKLFEQQRQDKEVILAQMREDRGALQKSLGEMTGTFTNFREQVAREIERRPDREEVDNFVDLKIKAAKSARGG